MLAAMQSQPLFAPPARDAAPAVLEAAAAIAASNAAAVAAVATQASGISADEAQRRCGALLAQLPPMEGSMKYKRAWSIDEALEQHQCLIRQHELQSQIGHNRVTVRKLQAEFARQASEQCASALESTLAAATAPDAAALRAAVDQATGAARRLQQALHLCAIEERTAAEKMRRMEEEIEKSNQEMVTLRESIEDVARGGGGVQVAGVPSAASNAPATSTGSASSGERKFFYCTDCRVGGHGQRFASYLLKRPNWRIYPSEKWFEDRNGQVSHCPIGKRAVDFTDETYFSRIAMHIKGRIWLEDKRKLYEFVPDLMPLTYVIKDQQWVGDPPPPEPPDAPPMPWFVKETDRNWGTSVVCCARPDECLGLSKANAVYVVQKHIPDPLLYTNGEKCHIKFYNLLVGMPDGVTWKLWTYADGYLSISPKAWSATDLSKETQVTIIRTKRINDWPHWQEVYPKCQQGVAEVVRRAAAQGKLEGRNKIQFEIISADYIVTANKDVFLLEFNTGPVLKDPDDSPDVHDAGMVSGALQIIEPYEGGSEDLWDFVLECKGVPPSPEDASRS